ncbi:SCO3242 family prenyltransferase [Streptomyces solisilvae]|uniref:SCO3242 family prenyltransferase n=1 Tax=Streptomyces malaysiensis TaxID=92644 RepID=UPI003721CC22
MTRAVGKERGDWGSWGDWAELLRVSALFTVPGDALAGAAAARTRPNRGTALAVCASLCLYEAGMALNDWADRDIDAVERPGRPLPSGRIAPAAALTAATGLTAAGLLCAAAAGRPALATGTALAGAVWAYDLGLKNTPAGPSAMAAARALDLLLGATASAPAAARSALRPAAVLGAHTLAVTTVSRHEAVGGSSTAPLGALATGAAIAWAATRRPTSTAGKAFGARSPRAGRTAGVPTPVASTGGATAPHRRGTPGGDRIAGGPLVTSVVAAAPAAPGQGDRAGWRRAARRAFAPAGRLPAEGGVPTPGRGPAADGAVGRTLTGTRSRSAAARHTAATVRAAASPEAAVRGATAAVSRGFGHAWGKGAGTRRGGGAAGRLVAVAAAIDGHLAPPGGIRAGAAPPRSTGTSALPGAAAGRFAALAGVALAGGYLATVARPLAHAALNPSPYFLQRAVGSGIRAMIPLQAVLASRAGAHRTAAGLLALMPVARRLSRKVSAT